MPAAIQPRLIEELRRTLGTESVLTAPSDLLVYECDGFVIEMASVDAEAQHLHTVYHDLGNVLGRTG